MRKIIVCQTGSRHRYLIPEILNNNHLLSRLYTDTTAYSVCGKLAKFFYKIGIRNNILLRIIKRSPNLPKFKLYTTDTLLIKELLYKLFSKDSYQQRLLHYNGFVNKCISWGVSDSDCIYNMYIENFDFLKYAKSKGAKIVIDIYEIPMTYKYLIEEIQNNPEYHFFSFKIKSYQYSHDVRMKYINPILKLADYYTIPSLFVKKSMSVFKEFDEKKAKLIPYPSSIITTKYNYTPQKHRIIWVGNDPVRKGLLYCAKAADILIKKYPDLDFRIIGFINEEIKSSESFKNLNFIGILNKEQLIEEYKNAEVYVFPTLYEGFAGTIIEAASCGCPIITTECSGADINEFPAIYIPTKDYLSIVENVSMIFEDSSLRDNLSQSVYRYSQKLTPKSYEKNIVSFFQSI